MLKGTIKIVGCLIMVLGVTSLVFAAATQTITVRAVVPTLNGMTVTISRVVGTTWTALAANTLMDFTTLTLDTTNHIFTAPHYFAVDVGVLNNNAWSLTHTPSSVFNTTTGVSTQRLDSNINVSFLNQLNDTTSTDIAKVSFANSSRTITNTAIASGWLRIYYGIGTGSGDNTGVVPIPQTQVGGTYQGSVTLSLTP